MVPERERLALALRRGGARARRYAYFNSRMMAIMGNLTTDVVFCLFIDRSDTLHGDERERVFAHRGVGRELRALARFRTFPQTRSVRLERYSFEQGWRLLTGDSEREPGVPITAVRRLRVFREATTPGNDRGISSLAAAAALLGRRRGCITGWTHPGCARSIRLGRGGW